MAKLQRLLPLTFALSLFGLVFGAKLCVIGWFGSDMPNWDQWDAEGTNLFLPYFQGHLKFLDLFKPHNEHRIFFTKVLNLGLLRLGGQWDSRVDCTANAILHSALAVAIFMVGRRLLARRWHASLFAACALLFGLPIAWQNILGGFHSQQYFLLWFSLGTLYCLCFARVGSCLWWLGLALGVLANFTMGSGLFAAAAVVGMLLLRALRRQVAWREIGPTLAGCSMAIAVGLATRAPAPWHEAYKAKSFHDFSFTIIHSLQWPNLGAPWFALIVYTPLALFAWQMLFRRTGGDARAENLFLATGTWLLLQYLATGYARGHGGPWPESRYLDTVAFGLLFNGILLAFLLDHLPPASTWRIPCRLLCLIWLGVVGPGLWHHTEATITNDLPHMAGWFRTAERNVRAYLETNDYAYIDNQIIPYPSADALRERLSHPELRALMPASVRPPLPLDYTMTPPGAFIPDGTAPPTPPLQSIPEWGSFSAGGTTTQGDFKSRAFTPAFDGYLKIETAGYPGEPGLSVQIIDAKTGRPLAEARPYRQPRESWHGAYVRVPRRPLMLIATNHNSAHWLAFSEPVEMTTLSYYTLQLVKQGRLILIIAASAALLLGLFQGICAFRGPPRT